MEQHDYDVVIVGGGAAGLSAALVLGRARRTVAVVDAGAPRNAPAAHMQGFLSRDGMPPQDLLEIGREEVTGYGVEIIDGSVTQIEPGFVVRLASGDTLAARRVLLTTGVSDDLPAIPGVRERWGRDLLHCPYCHGWEVRDQPLGVLGTHPAAVAHAQLIRQWSDDVVFFAHTGDVSAPERAQLAARGIRVVDGEVVRLVVDDDRLTGVELADGSVVPRTAVFIRPRNVPHPDRAARGIGRRRRCRRVRRGRPGRPHEHARRVGRRQRRRSARVGDRRRGCRRDRGDGDQRGPRAGRRAGAGIPARTDEIRPA